MRVALLAAAVLMTGGCVQTIAQDRVQTALLDAGLGTDDASCMAERMVDRLSIEQLKKLEGLKPLPGEPKRPATLAQFVSRVERVGDAEVVAVATTSAALCASGLANEARD